MGSFDHRQDGITGFDAWKGSNNEPILAKNTTNATIYPVWSNHVPARGILVHPTNSKLVIASWRSPISGSVNVAGAASDLDAHGGDGIRWYIDKNTSNLAYGSYPDGGSQSFHNGVGGDRLANLSVNQGDRLYFVVHPKSEYSYDSTGLVITITAVSCGGGCSISGTIVDSSGAGVSGVSVTDGQGHWTSTGQNGSYTLSGLAAGSYTVSPSKTGYTFAPTSRSATVPPNASGVNFLATPTVVAQFSAYPLSGPAPLAVSFVDQTIGTVTAYRWDFGDGAVSTQRYPAHTYASAGIYTVSLTVSGSFGSLGVTKSRFITATGTLSGRVTDGLGNPVQNVTITNGAGRAAVTGGDGAYVLADVPPGQYTMTAIRPGYTFTPANRPATVPGIATGLDFTQLYALSGRVLDLDSQPVSSVRVTLSNGRSAISGDDGRFEFKDVPASAYTVVLKKQGFGFEPYYRLVSVPPNASTVDFTARRPVVVLVHGFQGTASQVRCDEGITKYPSGQTLGALADWLANDGFEVWSAHLDTGPDYTVSLRSNAGCLRLQIKQVRDRAPGGKVILIAHSMGGLVARAYLEEDSTIQDSLYRNDVKILITLGSPHMGIPIQLWDAVKSVLYVRNHWTCDNQKALCEFTEGIDTFNQQYSARRTSVDYYAVGGDLDFWQASASGQVLLGVTYGLGLDKSDGIVPQSNSTYLPGLRQALATNEAHTKDLGLYSYYDSPPGEMTVSSAYARCVKPVLAGFKDGCEAASSNVAAAPVARMALSVNALSPIVAGALASGQQTSRTVGLEGGSALFAVTWATGTITFTLINPEGQVVDAAFALSHPDEVNFQPSSAGQDLLGASYTITAAQAGQWTMNLQAGDIPVEGTPYTSFVAMESAITLAAHMDRSWYLPGAQALITATLSGSPASALVTATIVRADGMTDTLALEAVSAGVYRGAYAVPDAPGYAEVRLLASGDTQDAIPFERSTLEAFQISPHSVTLSGAYSDSPLPHPSLPGAYESLTVTVGIQVMSSGTYGLSADLVDAAGNFVAHNLAVTDFAPGAAAWTLRFDGAAIYASRRNGPYRLTHVLLTDQSGATLVIDEAQDVYTTAAYDHRSFRGPMLYLPVVH
jgi:PKD repeat protein